MHQGMDNIWGVRVFNKDVFLTELYDYEISVHLIINHGFHYQMVTLQQNWIQLFKL